MSTNPASDKPEDIAAAKRQDGYYNRWFIQAITQKSYPEDILEGFAGELNPKQERMMNRSLLRVLDLRALIGDVVDLDIRVALQIRYGAGDLQYAVKGAG